MSRGRRGRDGTGHLTTKPDPKGDRHEPDRHHRDERLDRRKPGHRSRGAERKQNKFVADRASDGEEGHERSSHAQLGCPIRCRLSRIRRDEESAKDAGDDDDRVRPPGHCNGPAEYRAGNDRRGDGDEHRGEDRSNEGDDPAPARPVGQHLPVTSHTEKQYPKTIPPWVFEAPRTDRCGRPPTRPRDGGGTDATD